MATLENVRHDLLLIIAVAIIIIFITGLAVPVDIPSTPILLPG